MDAFCAIELKNVSFVCPVSSHATRAIYGHSPAVLVCVTRLDFIPSEKIFVSNPPKI